jgi:7tm Odorant receptor
MRKPFEVCFGILKFFGLWIDGEETRRYRIRGIASITFCPISFLILLSVGIYQKGKSEIFVELAEPITFALASAVMVGRIFDFFTKIHDIKNLYNSFEKIVSKYVKNGQFIKKRVNSYLKIFTISLISAILSVIAGYFVSFQTRELPYPVAVPFDTQSEVGFWTVYIYLFIAVGYVGPLYPALGLLPIFFMNFVIGFMEDFNESLGNIGKVAITDFKDAKEIDDLITKELQNNIEVYEKIKFLIAELTRIFKLTFFVKGVVGSIIICTSVFVIPLVS